MRTSHSPGSITNAAVYIGRGELIERGFVTWEGGVITGAGPMAGYARRSGRPQYDLGGCLVVPGLVDCHIHLVGFALSLTRIDLSDTGSAEEGLERIAGFLEGMPAGVWLKGRGWDKQRWGMDGFPDRGMLDRVSPRNPVELWSRDGHILWVNSMAMELSGIGRAGAVQGGEIERDREGRPTGIFKEQATKLITRRSGSEDVDASCRAVESASAKLRALGLTGLHTSENEEYAEILAAAVGRGLVGLNLFRMFETDDPAQVGRIAEMPGVDCVKVLVDGALGSQTAGMLEPYCGGDNLGVIAVPADRLRDIVSRARDSGLSLAVHAIGDKANREVLDVYEETSPAKDGRHSVLRVEHAQLLHPDDVPRFGRLGVIASMQPIHLVSDTGVAGRYWGDRSRWAYAWGSISRGGGVLAFGSDAPIEEPDPLKGIHAAVTRRDPGREGSEPWYPEECIGVSEALDAYTQGAAFASGAAGRAGAIRPGRRADLTILTRNILRPGDPDAILETGIAGTVVAGDALIS
jgi:predicted amidohydrolase YtcJ